MALRYRPMRPKDLRECVEIVAAHRAAGPRYGQVIKDLQPAWISLLGSEAFKTAVFEEVEGKRTRICAVCASVCVTDDFVRELKAAPFWAGPELARRIARGGNSPVLTDQQVREANSCAGMNLLAWECCIPTDFENYGELHRQILLAFIELNRGYLWKQVIAAPVETGERLQWTIKTGGLLWDVRQGRWLDSLEGDLAEIAAKPHLVGVPREIELSRAGSWVGALFEYRVPQLGFTRSEQQLLLAAIAHGTDEELSKELGKSLSTVKNTWGSIYDRAASRLPDLFSEPSPANSRNAERGKEKRRRLLAYLQEHPEELRPASQKLLRQKGSHRQI